VKLPKGLDMTHEAVIQRLCQIPKEFRKGGKSPIQLVAESGVDQLESVMTVSALADYLDHHLHLVEDWLHWSEDKRGSPSWYFTSQEKNYEVGFYPEGESMFFTDRIQACAEFIVREVSHIRDIRERFKNASG
jgi:hypothetical protein